MFHKFQALSSQIFERHLPHLGPGRGRVLAVWWWAAWNGRRVAVGHGKPQRTKTCSHEVVLPEAIGKPMCYFWWFLVWRKFERQQEFKLLLGGTWLWAWKALKSNMKRKQDGRKQQLYIFYFHYFLLSRWTMFYSLLQKAWTNIVWWSKGPTCRDDFPY